MFGRTGPWVDTREWGGGGGGRGEGGGEGGEGGRGRGGGGREGKGGGGRVGVRVQKVSPESYLGCHRFSCPHKVKGKLCVRALMKPSMMARPPKPSLSTSPPDRAVMVSSLVQSLIFTLCHLEAT